MTVTTKKEFIYLQTNLANAPIMISMFAHLNVFKRKKRHGFLFEKCAFLPNRFEMKSRQTRKCSQRVRLQRVRVLFHRLISRCLLKAGGGLVAWTTQPPEPKKCQKTEYFITERSVCDSRYLMCSGEAAEAGINVCAHASSKAAAQKTNRNWKKKKKKQRELRHFGEKEKKQKQRRPCEAAFARRSQHQIYGSVFIIYVRTGFHHTWRELAQLQTLQADWLLKCSSGWLRLPARCETDAKLLVWFPTPSTGNLARPLIPSQTPTQCLPSGNTEVKSATQVSPICHKCWRRRQGFEARAVNVVAEVKSLNPKVLC